MAEIASAFVTIAPSMRGFRSEVSREAGRAGDDASRTIGSRMGKQGRGIGRTFGKAFALGVTGAAAAGAVLLRGAVDEAIEAQKVTATTKQIIKATGGAANISAKQVDALATSISNKVGVDDEAIASGANLLLTFKQVREETGKGNDIFSRATKAAVDLSAAGFGSITSGSKMLGKALNDPLKGITALSRAGVTFTQKQKDQIKALVESGKSLQAQKLILKEVEGKVGGTAKATATSGEKMRVAWGNVQEELGTALLPALSDLAFFTRKEILPAISDTVAKLSANKDEIRATAREWGGNFLSALKGVWAVAKPVLQTLNAIPSPLKSIAVQAGLAGVALKKLNFFSLTSQMATLGKNADGTAKSVSRFGMAARNAAGVAGVLALAQGATAADKKLSILGTTAGGALLGFSVGGPWGAAIGAGAGALIGLVKATNKSKDALAGAREPAVDFASSLNDITGAATRATRAVALQALQQKGAVSAANELGISTRDLVSATLGNEQASRRIGKVLKGQLGITSATVDAFGQVQVQYTGNARAAGIVGDAIARTTPKLEAQRRQVLANALATGDLSKVLRGIPKNIATKISQTGDPAKLTKLLQNYIRTGKLTPKEIKTVVKATNLAPVGKNIDAFVRKLVNTSRTAAETGPKVNAGLKKAGNVKPSNAWLHQLSADIAGGKSAASSGGSQIGSALGAGIAGGIGSWVNRISSAASSAVSFAVAAAKRAGKIKSPSRLTMYLGKMLGLGLAKGIEGTNRTVGLSMERVIDALEAGVKKKNIGKALAKHVRAGVKAIEREMGTLQKLVSARNDLAGSIGSGLRGEFDLSAITSAGEPNEFGFSAPAQPAKAAQAIVARMKTFAGQIGSLIRAKFPPALVQEIAGMGSLEGGKAAAAFLSASAADRGSLLKAYGDIATYSQSIGNAVANQQYGGKIAKQQDVIDAMERGIEKGLHKVKVEVQLGVGKRDSAKIYLQGKHEAEAKK